MRTAPVTFSTLDGATVTYMPRAHAFVIRYEGRPAYGRWMSGHGRERFWAYYRTAAAFRLGRDRIRDVLFIQHEDRPAESGWLENMLWLDGFSEAAPWRLLGEGPGPRKLQRVVQMDMTTAAQRLQRFARGAVWRRARRREVALAMAWHARLGAGSALGGLEPGLLRAICTRSPRRGLGLASA